MDVKVKELPVLTAVVMPPHKRCEGVEKERCIRRYELNGFRPWTTVLYAEDCMSPVQR